MPNTTITTTSKGWPLLNIDSYLEVTPEYTRQLANKLENGDADVAAAINAAQQAQTAATQAGVWTAIAASTNLDTLRTTGRYHCLSDTTAAGLVNSPTGYSFIIEVFAPTTFAAWQRLTTYKAAGGIHPATYVRQYYIGTWSAWQRLATASAAASNIAAGSGVTLTDSITELTGATVIARLTASCAWPVPGVIGTVAAGHRPKSTIPVAAGIVGGNGASAVLKIDSAGTITLYSWAGTPTGPVQILASASWISA